jgi:5-methylcytosine-specific restriction endonuclease McrA
MLAEWNLNKKVRATAAQRGYGSAWQKYRSGYLLSHPYCVKCGKVASVVDHVKPHRGDQTLFWDKETQQGLRLISLST